MDHRNAAQQYTETAVQTGSPARLVAMLYQGALRFVGEAEDAIRAGDTPRKADRINRAIRIVQELSNALDREAAPELCDRLESLYEYVEYELLQASTFNETQHLDHCRRVLGRLANSWEELASQNVEPAAPRASAPAPTTPTTAPDDESPNEPVSSLSISA